MDTGHHLMQVGMDGYHLMQVEYFKDLLKKMASLKLPCVNYAFARS